jgi:hypothetical protein
MHFFSYFIYSKIKSDYIPNNEPMDPIDEDSFLSKLNNIRELNPTISITATWEEFNIYIETTVKNVVVQQLKDKRNALLQQTDWVMTYDNVQTLANLDEWMEYRQKLRDYFSNPSFLLILEPGRKTPDLSAMNFPPKQPPILRKL